MDKRWGSVESSKDKHRQSSTRSIRLVFIFRRCFCFSSVLFFAFTRAIEISDIRYVVNLHVYLPTFDIIKRNEPRFIFWDISFYRPTVFFTNVHFNLHVCLPTFGIIKRNEPRLIFWDIFFYRPTVFSTNIYFILYVYLPTSGIIRCIEPRLIFWDISFYRPIVFFINIHFNLCM